MGVNVFFDLIHHHTQLNSTMAIPSHTCSHLICNAWSLTCVLHHGYPSAIHNMAMNVLECGTKVQRLTLCHRAKAPWPQHLRFRWYLFSHDIVAAHHPFQSVRAKASLLRAGLMVLSDEPILSENSPMASKRLLFSKLWSCCVVVPYYTTDSFCLDVWFALFGIRITWPTDMTFGFDILLYFASS